MEKLSFLNEDHIFVLKGIAEMIPGLEKLYTVYYDKRTDSVRSVIMEESSSGNTYFQEMEIIVPAELIGNLRVQKLKHIWLNRDDIPFESTGSRGSKEIFDEIENRILLLRFMNRDDKLSDLYFVHFKRNLGNFRLTRSDKPLSTDNKAVIGMLVHQLIESMLERKYVETGLFNNIRLTDKALINSAAQLKTELIRVQHEYSNSIANLCHAYLEKYSLINGVKYILEHEALIKLQNFKGNINHIEQIIRNSVNYANNMLYGEVFDEILIKEWFINLDDFQNQQVTVEFEPDSKYTKTIDLLNRLENAAIKVRDGQQKLTGTNVGNAMTQSISGPAITDALKKHRSKIRYLFDKYPERWDYIRKKFKPVLNLVESFKQTGTEMA